MRPLFERGLARPLIDTVLPLEEVKKAHERLNARHAHCKIVLQVAGEEILPKERMLPVGSL
jgi:NADPH2:quinone reductase